MKRVTLLVAALGTLAAFCAWGAWVYGGQWQGFNLPGGIAAASDNTVYVADTGNHRIVGPSGPWGKKGTGTGEFNSPRGVGVARNGNVYVADMNNNRIQYFTARGSFLGWRGSEGTAAGQFINPTDVAVDLGGYVFVADRGNRRIQYFTANGSFVASWGHEGGGGGNFDPYGVAVAAGRKIYVSDCNNHWMRRLLPGNGWGTRGPGKGQFEYPHDLALAPDGDVYVADCGNHRIQYFAANGSFRGMWGSQGEQPGEFDSPHDVTITPNGKRAFFADTENHRVQYYRWTEPVVAPASLGSVKALFR